MIEWRKCVKIKGTLSKRGKMNGYKTFIGIIQKSFKKPIAPKSLNLCGIILGSVHSSVLKPWSPEEGWALTQIDQSSWYLRGSNLRKFSFKFVQINTQWVCADKPKEHFPQEHNYISFPVSANYQHIQSYLINAAVVIWCFYFYFIEQLQYLYFNKSTIIRTEWTEQTHETHV